MVGLTTAITIQEKGGYNVTIIAETWPSDPKTVKYTSFWAVCHSHDHQRVVFQHAYHAQGASHGCYRGPDQKLRSKPETLPQHYIVLEPYSSLVQRSAKRPSRLCGSFQPLMAQQKVASIVRRNMHSTTMVLANMRTTCRMSVTPERPRYRMSSDHRGLQLKKIPDSNLRGGAKAGYSFNSYVIDPPVYLNYLLSRFIARGGHIVHGTVQHVSQIVQGGVGIWVNGKRSAAPDALVISNGLGARCLGGVDDSQVYPNRGQNVIIHAPWVTDAMSLSSPDPTIDTYVFPRRNGDVSPGKVHGDPTAFCCTHTWVHHAGCFGYCSSAKRLVSEMADSSSGFV